jgi:ubiquinone/menaquinone biosynthesis C-methylase UbiE
MEQRIVPGLTSSQDVYLSTLETHVLPGTRWLDLGCGSAVLPVWRHDAERALVARAGRVVGIDRSVDSLRRHRTIQRRVHGDIAHLPFDDRAFDLVTANMVVEHMDDPLAQFLEIRRVLAPGGVFVFHTPNARGYPTLVARLLPDGFKRMLARGLEGRQGDDVFKTYYRANSPARLQRLAALSNLQVRGLVLALSSAVLAIVPPLALVELLWIRALRRAGLETWRPTMVATLTRD